MSHPQFHPLQVHSATQELFLRLAAPLDNIIITTPRLTDAPRIVQLLNDPAIISRLKTPPYPYLLSHAESWLHLEVESSDRVVGEVEQAGMSDGQMTVGGCPIDSIREVREDGTDVFIGNISILRCDFGGEPPEVRTRLKEENAQKAVGDPTIVWCIGYYLASSHHGRGIMSAALRLLIHSWAIPRMGARQFRVEAFQGNLASVRVFEKMGFKVEKTVDEEVKTSYGNVVPGQVVLWWRHE